MPAEVAARTGPSGDAVTAAEMSFQQDNPSALQAYQDLLRQAEAGDRDTVDARSREFMRHRVAGLELEQRLAAGEWVRLQPDRTNAPGWVVLGGTIRVPDTNTLEVTSAERGGHLLYCLARLGKSFELRGEIEVIQAADGQGAAEAGFVFGQPTWDDGPWYTVRATRNQSGQSRVRYSRSWLSRDVSAPVMLRPGPAVNTLHVTVSEHRATVTLNGQSLLSEARLEDWDHIRISDFMAGLGADSPPGSVVRYRSFEARKR
jgi:hypothetical protein